MRRVFGKIINEFAKEDKKIVLLVGDIGTVYLMISER